MPDWRAPVQPVERLCGIVQRLIAIDAIEVDVRQWTWPSKQVALDCPYTCQSQQLKLFRRFDSFCCRRDVKAMRECQGCRDNRGAVGSLGHVGRERFVDFILSNGNIVS